MIDVSLSFVFTSASSFRKYIFKFSRDLDASEIVFPKLRDILDFSQGCENNS